MERLSALDAEFLHLEDGVAHLHIAGISIFAGPAPDEADLVALLASKLHLIPRYRQRVRSVPFELGRPVWEDDPHFRIEYHVRHTALPAPGDDAALGRLMARLMSQPLDRNRPLWEAWLVEGLADDRWAIIFKVHHCMVDGIAGVGLLSAVLDIDPAAEIGEPEPWTPAPEASGPALVIDAWSGLGRDLLERAKGIPNVVANPVTTARSVAETLGGLLQFGEHLNAVPTLSIEGSIGPHRAWAHSSASIADVKEVRRALGGTLNDVVLAAVTRGYRDYLAHRGDDPDSAVVRTLVPVSVRGAGGAGVLDNRVSALLLEMPVDEDHPITRFETVRHRMADLKLSHMADFGDWFTHAGDLLPPPLVGAASRAAIRAMQRMPQRSVTTVTTNVPGPQFPLYCLGREMLEYRPFVPISHGVRVGTAILSYNGQLSFGITGDEDTASDVEVLAKGISAGIDELVDLTHTHV